MSNWITTAPTRPGWYYFRSDETGGDKSKLLVYWFKDELWVDCPDTGKNPVSHFHDGLTAPTWRVFTKTLPKMRKPRLTPTQTAEVIALKKQGATKSQIRDKMDIGETAIEQAWTKHLKDHPEDRPTSSKSGNRGI